MKNDEHFEVNLRALRRRYPEYAEVVSGVAAPTAYLLERRGKAVLCRTQDGKWIHGPDDPWKEATRDAKQLVAADAQLYLVLRPGLGYHAIALVEELAEREPGSVVIVVEDRLHLWKAGLQSLDWCGVLYARCSVLLLGNPYEVIEAYLDRHPSLRLLPVTLVAPPEVAENSECAELGNRLTAQADRFRDAAEGQLGSASVMVRERRERAAPLRVVIAGNEAGYLLAPLEAGFRKCGCDVVAHASSQRLPRDVRSADSLLELLRLLPDVVVWINRPEMSPAAREALRALGTVCVLWSVDSPRRMGLGRDDLDSVDLHVCFDSAYLEPEGVGVAARMQLSLGAGIQPLPGCDPADEIWPARAGADITFVGALGESRMRDLRETLQRRDPRQLALLERLAAEAGDPATAYEAAQDAPYSGAPCMYVDELRSKVRRARVLSAVLPSSLSIFGDVEWATAGGELASCYAGRTAHYGFDLASLYYHSKINLNVFHEQCVDSTNSRVYDVLAAGGFLLTEDRPCLGREFEVGRHLVTFSSAEDAKEKAAYYLAHPDLREAIAREGQRHVLSHHTFEHRCRALIERVRPLVGKDARIPTVIDPAAESVGSSASPGNGVQAPRSGANTRIHYFCPDVSFHSGGVRALYRHVSILQRHGLEATIVHQAPGFRAPDLPDVPVQDLAAVRLGESDVVVIPEGCSPWMADLRNERARRIAIALNWKYVYAGLPSFTDWRAFGIERVLCNSPFVADFVSWSMSLPVHLFRWGVDKNLFYPEHENKARRVVYIQRKAAEVEELKRVLHARDPRLVKEIEWRALANLPTQEDYAREVRSASLFLNLSSAEGLPASLIEAMSSGTLVAGYNGVGGQRELIGSGHDQNCILAENLDYVTLAQRLEPVLLGVLAGDTTPWEPIVKNGLETAARYSLEEEQRSVLSMWQEILGLPRVPAHAGARRLHDVAARPGASRSAAALDTSRIDETEHHLPRPYGALCTAAQDHLLRYTLARSFCSGKIVLDGAMGCGYGSLVLPAKEYIGIDRNEDCVAFARKHYGPRLPHARYEVGDVTQLPLPDESIDVYVSFETIEHLARDRVAAFLAEARRVLLPGAAFLCSSPIFRGKRFGVTSPHHRFEYVFGEFEHALKEGGFRVERTWYQSPFLYLPREEAPTFEWTQGVDPHVTIHAAIKA